MGGGGENGSVWKLVENWKRLEFWKIGKALACGGRKEIKEKEKWKRNDKEKIFSWKGI